MSDWKNVKEDGMPEAGRRVHLKLYAEYHGHFEPEEGEDKKGQWFMDHPALKNVSEWKYLLEKEEPCCKESEEEAS